MFITDIISITELSRLTGKSRPTIYKYINDYNIRNYDDIPFSIIELFNISSFCSKSDIIAYCQKTYGIRTRTYSEKTQEIIELIIENEANLKIDRIKAFVLEELKNDK